VNPRNDRDAILIAVPYAVLLAMAILAIALPAWMEPGAKMVWTALRWLVRFGTLAGAFWAWRRNARSPRPLWAYVWLGFATYEVVGILLLLVAWLASMIGAGNVAASLIVGLLLSAFLPEAIVGLWLALRSRLQAAYTVFPHAAVTAPLFLLTGVAPVERGLRGAMIASMLPLVLAATGAILFAYVPRDRRWPFLFAVLAVCQVTFAVTFVVTDSAPIFIVVALLILGILILTLPSILYALYLFVWHTADAFGWADRYPPAIRPASAEERVFDTWDVLLSGNFSDLRGGGTMATGNEESQTERIPDLAIGSEAATPREPMPPPTGPSTLDRMYKGAVVILTVLIVLAVGLVIARAAVYKIHEYERGLHLRGGRFLGVQNPGWHMQIPLVDTVMVVKTNERLGYVEQIPAMTSDDVTMIVSLQYTYKVNDPEQYALQVDDPERIVFEFVQGKLRDVVNTKEMSDIMNNRAVMNQEVMEALKDKEQQYGVEFITVQMQNASPPEEVLTAIKDRMVALQRQEQAQAEAAQQQTIADADLYAAEKEADAEAYQITTTAQAEAERIRLTSAAEKEAVNALLAELEGKGAMAEKFIDYLIAQELKENSKWVIGGGEGTPILDMR